jgi:hypothetical protein
MIFDSGGIADRPSRFCGFVAAAMTHPSQSQLPSIDEINSGVVASVLRGHTISTKTKESSVMTTGGIICSG